MAERAKLLPDPGAARQAVRALLSEEQNKKLDELLVAMRPGPGPMRPGQLLERLLNPEVATRLGLTDEQKAKLQALAKDFKEAMGKLEGPDNEKARRELADKLLKDIQGALTAEQWDKVKAMLAPPPPPGPGGRIERLVKELNLTAEQAKAVAELQAKFAEAEKAATSDDARRALFTKLMDDIKALLTAEQKAKLEQLMQRRPPAGGGDRRPEGPQPPPPPPPAGGSSSAPPL